MGARRVMWRAHGIKEVLRKVGLIYTTRLGCSCRNSCSSLAHSRSNPLLLLLHTTCILLAPLQVSICGPRVNPRLVAGAAGTRLHIVLIVIGGTSLWLRSICSPSVRVRHFGRGEVLVEKGAISSIFGLTLLLNSFCTSPSGRKHLCQPHMLLGKGVALILLLRLVILLSAAYRRIVHEYRVGTIGWCDRPSVIL